MPIPPTAFDLQEADDEEDYAEKEVVMKEEEEETSECKTDP